MSKARRARTCCKATLDMAGFAAGHNAEPCSARKSARQPGCPSRLDNAEPTREPRCARTSYVARGSSAFDGKLIHDSDFDVPAEGCSRRGSDVLIQQSAIIPSTSPASDRP